MNLYLIYFSKYLYIFLVSHPKAVVLFWFIKQNNTKGSPPGMCLSKSEFMFSFPCSPLPPCITVTSKCFSQKRHFEYFAEEVLFIVFCSEKQLRIRLLCSLLLHGYQNLCHFNLDCLSA